MFAFEPLPPSHLDELTPRETYLAIEAAVWRDERMERHNLSLAWHTAAMTRAKRLPSLKSLVTSTKKSKPLKGSELTERRREFTEMTENLDIEKLTENLKRKGRSRDRAEAQRAARS